MDGFFLENDEQVSRGGPQSSPAPCVLKLVTPTCSLFVSRDFTLAQKEVG